MARYTGPKDRLSRREGFDLFGKGMRLTRLEVPPGVHGAKRRRKISEYGRQLREKQKVKRMYGMLEKQFKRAYLEAIKSRGNTGERLLSLLEMRLDNTVYRLGFSPTRPAARQLVSHRHVLVNGKKVNIPSYRLSAGDIVSLDRTSSEIPAVKKLLIQKDFTLPAWLKRKSLVGKVDREPTRDDIPEPITEQDIIEFYSR